jgi:hypothetical protein
MTLVVGGVARGAYADLLKLAVEDVSLMAGTVHPGLEDVVRRA